MTTLLHQRSTVKARLLTPLRAPVVVADPNVTHSQRLILRPLMDADRAAFISLLRECRHALADFFPLHRPGETDEQVFERQAAFSRGALLTGRAWRRVLCLCDGTLVGAINLNDISDRPAARAELNLWLSPRFHGRGLASEAIDATLHHAFLSSPGGLGLERVWAYVAPDNMPSVKALSRLGFERDARALPVQLNLAGCWKTHHVYQRLAPGVVAEAARRCTAA